MKRIEVAKGTFQIVRDKEATLVAKDLGATLCICVRDASSGIIGLCSIVVPLLKQALSEEFPSFECSRGLKAFFQALGQSGVQRESMEVWLAGVGQFMECPKEMNIGLQLYSMVKKVLEKNAIKVKGEFVGGPFNKTVRLGHDLGPEITAPGTEKES